MSTYTVEELVVPATMDDDPELVRAFSDWLAVSDAAEVAVHGLPELSWTPPRPADVPRARVTEPPVRRA